MNENVADSELFGHRKGAFTGAIHSRLGVFEAATGGTLFLDEIADLAPAIQVKLLRVLEDKQVRPLGTHESITVDTRVICASWAELGERVACGSFRTDLLHRISTIRLELPTLRCRKEDLAELSQHWLERYKPEFGPKELTATALERLAAYDWPGNVRELGSVLYRAAAETHDRAFIDGVEVEHALPAVPRKRAKGIDLGELQRLLDANGGNVSAAARAARVPRSTFRTLLKRQMTQEPDAPEHLDPAVPERGGRSTSAGRGILAA
jgi:two-component system response regulator GlrR